MDSLNQEILDRCGVTAWHEAGYRGQRGLSAIGERFRPHLYPRPDLVQTPLGVIDEADEINEQHALCSALVHHLFAPERTLVQLPFETGISRRGYQSELISMALPHILKNRVDIMFISCSTDIDGLALDGYLKEAAGFLSIFMAAGNDGEQRANQYLTSHYINGVGACFCREGLLEPAPYSSHSEHILCAGPTELPVTFPSGESEVFGGTSAAAPAVAGMAALVNDLFMEQTGRPLSFAQMRQFISEHCQPVGQANQCGYGLPVLPPPGSVDLRRYQPPRQKLFSFPFKRLAK